MLNVNGNAIRIKRREREMTAKELAALVGCQPGYLLQIERNEVRPSMTLLEKIANALKVHPAELMNLNGLPSDVSQSIEEPADPLTEMLLNTLLRNPGRPRLIVGTTEIEIPEDILEPVLKFILSRIKKNS